MAVLPDVPTVTAGTVCFHPDLPVPTYNDAASPQ